MFFPINEEGEYLILTENFLGIIPLSFEDTYGSKESSFSLAHSWIIATLQKQAGKETIMWGWASSELSKLEPSLWKDVDFYEDYKQTENFRISKPFKLGSIGPEIKVRFAEGPFWVGEFPDGLFQFYVYPNSILKEGTLDKPNTYSGKIKSAKTYNDAVDLGETFLESFADDTNYDYSKEITNMTKEMKENNFQNIKLEKMMAEEKEQKKKRERERIETEKREWEIWRAQRENAAARAYQSNDLTSRLRHIGNLGSTTRATKALKSINNRLRKAQGKAYQAR